MQDIMRRPNGLGLGLGLGLGRTTSNTIRVSILLYPIGNGWIKKDLEQTRARVNVSL